MIYLDSAATSKYSNIDDVIVNTITTAMKTLWQNPSSLYATNVKNEIDKCRENIASFIGAKPNEIYFTSGGSESNCWAVQGFINECKLNNECPLIITSAVEHKSIMECVLNSNANSFFIKVDNCGFIDIKQLEQVLSCESDINCKKLVSVQFANNEIGTIQHIKEISEIAHRYNALFHTDSVQTFGHIPIDVEELGVDLMSASGHKVSPVLRGIGFLYKRNGINIQPLIYGTQENKMRGSTENTYGIIGLSKALEYCDSYFNNANTMYDKRDYFIDLLRTKFGCKLNGHSEHRLPNNINVTFPQNITGESLLYTLDMSGIQISVGSACNSHSIEPSHVLKAIGLTDEEAMKTIRISLPNDITYDDIDYAIDEIYKTIRIIES